MKISVVGTGIMGISLTQILAQSDAVHQIILKGNNTSEEKVQEYLKNIYLKLKRYSRKNNLSQSTLEEMIKKITFSNQYESLQDSNCIIECVTEDIEIKKSVFSRINLVLRSNSFSSILITNTSSLSIQEMANTLDAPENFIGMHFFNPVDIINLVEIVTGEQTSHSTIAWAENFANQLNKEAIIIKDTPGFIVNRILIPMINEAIAIYAEGVATPEEIDKALCLGANHPIGPLALSDLIGNDTVLNILDSLFNSTRNNRYCAHPLLREKVASGYLGKKAKKAWTNKTN